MAFSSQNLGPYVTFDELSLGLNPQHVVGRVIRSWEVRSENNRDQFIGISMVMLDEKESTIYCFISSPLPQKQLSTLREGTIFQLGGFEVKPCTTHHKITDHPFVIKFLDQTTFVDFPTNWIKIGKDKFRVHTHDHLLAFANTNLALPGLNPTFTVTDITSKVHKKETITIGELCEFTGFPITQDADFICQATIVDVLSTYGWNHMTCIACVGELQAHENSLLCVQCQLSNPYRDDRFHVAFAILDRSDVATFLVSDKELRNLLPPHKFEELRGKVKEEIFPDLINSLDDLGNTLIFHIKVTAYNHSAKNRSFTVAKITNDMGHVQPNFSTVTIRQNEAAGTTNYKFDNCTGARGSSFTIPAFNTTTHKKHYT
ncbi:unnamed protein product [Thlaspi arvense]|uniref:Replication protein A 70 kDa DNA-binding subunit B/D first OB fold domain-containing protein n=1 Tax=Thlaspi arvense TaxID=13288 RepID=A0AAU9R9A7_THLAR|nr:unnamed protein product [Thlaspi arvense]